MNRRTAVSSALALILAGTFAVPAWASLLPFQTYHGHVGYSSDGFGSTNQDGTISAKVPVGSTVLAAYLYTSNYDTGSTTGDGTTFNGTTVNFGAPSVNFGPELASRRADVTSVVAPIINGGVGGVYNFEIAESDSDQDGEALVVVYTNPSLPADSTFAILDGFSATTGDTAKVNFASPLNPTAPGFFAEMFLGIGFSYDGDGCTGSDGPPQSSNVTVNGTLITASAGCNDDSIDATAANGNLITVGGFNDPYSPMLPTIAEDHERYDLVPEIKDGDTSITINTFNESNDDNIFLAGFYVNGLANVNKPPPVTGVPEPPELPLFGLGVAGLLGLGYLKRRRDRAAHS